MELSVTMNGMVLAVIALASIGGGLVLYRGSRQVGWRAVGMSAVALGVGVLLVFALGLPVSQSREGGSPGPVIVGKKVVSTQPTDDSTTSQEPPSPTSSRVMFPRPNSGEELVTQANVIVPGTITSVLDEKVIYADGVPFATEVSPIGSWMR